MADVFDLQDPCFLCSVLLDCPISHGCPELASFLQHVCALFLTIASDGSTGEVFFYVLLEVSSNFCFCAVVDAFVTTSWCVLFTHPFFPLLYDGKSFRHGPILKPVICLIRIFEDFAVLWFLQMFRRAIHDSPFHNL